MQPLRSIFSTRAVATRTFATFALTFALGACANEPDLGAWKQCTNDTFCPADTSCSADGASCERCGDNITSPREQCDDGDLINGDGCDSNCTPTGCGNGIVTSGEDCDDGNSVNGDGCDNTCASPVCGDCIVSLGEDCDDGNVNDGDGCDSNCKLTPGLPLTSPDAAVPGCPKGPER